jgi:hypothetical protein
VGLLVASCLDEPDCIRIADTAVVISFKKLSDNTKDTVVLYTIVAEANGPVADSTFYDYGNEPEGDTLRGVPAVVAVEPFSGATKFTFDFPLTQKYLELGYNTSIRFISEDCGSESIVTSLKILSTDFDSVRVVNNILTINRFVNIEIFN